MNIQIKVQPEVSIAVSVADPVISVSVEATPEIEIKPLLGAAVNRLVVTVQEDAG